VERATVNGRPWTEADDETLLAYAGQVRVRTIARRLRRSYGACLWRLWQLGVRVGEAQGYLTARCAADEYGVPVWRVQRWAAAGRVKARRGPHTWLIDGDDFERFVNAL
jgi:hypothetical protein